MVEFVEYLMYLTIGSAVGFWLWAIIAVKRRCSGGCSRLKHVGVQVELMLPDVPAAPAMPRMRLCLVQEVWLAPHTGRKYHLDERCSDEGGTKNISRCDRCATMAGY